MLDSGYLVDDVLFNNAVWLLVLLSLGIDFILFRVLRCLVWFMIVFTVCLFMLLGVLFGFVWLVLC